MASTEPVNQRARRELIMTVIHPLMAPAVALLAARGVNPLWIVGLHGACASVAAVFIVLGPAWWPWAAALLLLRMLLDNIDGALARASGQVTVAGRYFDTGLDLLTNFLLFAALATVSNVFVALAAFLVLMVLLSMEHNFERLYLEQRQGSRPELPLAPASGPQAILRPFRALYALVLEPQDRLIERLELARFRRLAGQPFSSAPLELKLAWFDLFSTAALVNLGLSTQTVLLALLLFSGFPQLYPLLVLLQGVLMLLVQLWRGQRFRRYLQVAVTGVS